MYFGMHILWGHNPSMCGASLCINSGDGCWGRGVIVDTVTLMCVPVVHVCMLFFSI